MDGDGNTVRIRFEQCRLGLFSSSPVLIISEPPMLRSLQEACKLRVGLEIVRIHAAARRLALFACCLDGVFWVPLVALFDFSFATNSCLTVAEMASTSTL